MPLVQSLDRYYHIHISRFSEGLLFLPPRYREDNGDTVGLSKLPTVTATSGDIQT